MNGSVTIKAFFFFTLHRYCSDPLSKYIFGGILNHFILSFLITTRLIFKRVLTLTLSVVEFLPIEPQPSVSDGVFVLYISPIAPCDDGEFTISLPVRTLLANSFITS